MRSSSIEQEFVILMKKKSADDELEDDIEEAFRVFDTNHDGLQTSLTVENCDLKFVFRVISADELMKVMISLGNPRTEAEVKVTDISLQPRT